MFRWVMFESMVMCLVCGVTVSKAQAKRTRRGGSAAVCAACYERWRRAGRVCVKCRRAVKRPHKPGVFSEWQSLGHAACGAAVFAG